MIRQPFPTYRQLQLIRPIKFYISIDELLLLLRFEVAELKSQVAELTLEVPKLSSGELRLTFTTEGGPLHLDLRAVEIYYFVL